MLKMRCFILIMITLLSSSDVFPQAAPDKSGKPQFSSVYTDRKRDCKPDASESERCKGYGGYTIHLSYPAVSQDVFIETKDGTSISVYPPDSPIKYLGGKLEWRLANGKPFAVIVRFTYHSMDDDKKTGGTKLNQVGEVLFAQGLEGYEKIDFVVDAKTPNANEKIRKLADSTFLAIPLEEVTAARTWLAFFEAFQSAVKRRDRVALKKMMDPVFRTGDGNTTTDPDSAFKFWDDPKVRGWEAFDKALAAGAIPLGSNRDGRRAGDNLNRIAPPAANSKENFGRGFIKWYARFYFKDGRWKCQAFIKCCAAPLNNHPVRRSEPARMKINSLPVPAPANSGLRRG